MMFAGRRRKWSPGELEFLRREFKGIDRPPSYGDIRRVQELCPALHRRSLAQIKSRIWALVSSK